MKETIALLLATASARVGIASTDNINAPFPDFAGTMSATIPQVLSGIAYATTATKDIKITAYAAATNSCVGCIRAGNMWCSVKAAADLAAGASWTSPATQLASGFKTLTLAMTVGATNDLGQCCALNSEAAKDPFYVPGWNNSLTQATGQVATSKIIAANVVLFNNYVCAARIKSITSTTMCDGTTASCGAAGTVGTVTGNYNNFEEQGTSQGWWCSNGRTNNASGTALAFGQAVWTVLPYNPIKAAPVTSAHWVGTQTSALIYAAGTVINSNQTGDARTDIMLMGCRQGATLCGGDLAVTTLAAVGTGGATQTRTLGALDKLNKCTFVYGSTKGAPTFKANKKASTTFLTKYDLHYAEYSTNSDTSQPVLDATSKVPNPGFTWSALKARMYDTNSATQYAKYQVLPNVWGWQNPAQVTGKPDFSAKSWFPVAMAAAQIKAQKAVNTAYSGKVTIYDGLRTTYDTAVKPSTKKPDFFATMFNPPKKTKIPQRPNKPDQPAAYAGVYQQPWVTSWSFSANSVRAKMGNTQFQVAGDHGGWGGFTVGLMGGITADLIVQHSYGVFGWSTDDAIATGYKAEAQSYTADWADMCFATTGTNGQCPSGMTAPSTALTVANTAYIAVTIWANDNTAATFGSSASGAVILFSTKDYAQNAAAWAMPAQPAAAIALSTPAGAKALAASAAAAAAVAAALY